MNRIVLILIILVCNQNYGKTQEVGLYERYLAYWEESGILDRLATLILADN